MPKATGDKNAKRAVGKRRWGILVTTATVTLLAVTALRLFVLATFEVPSGSMKPAIVPGDHILVNKLIMGPRLIKKPERNSFSSLSVSRLKGFGKIRRNDVLVFNIPVTNWLKPEFDPDVFYVKRCIGMPGDTFYIENGFNRVKGSPEILGDYQAQVKLSQINEPITQRKKTSCFPYHPDYPWNRKDFGPLYIPRKGDTIPVDTAALILYRDLIVYDAQQPVRIKEGKIFLGTEPLATYTFQQNYYFFAGDNIPESRDSRQWGLIPEDFIVGKATRIWKSKDPVSSRYRWNRFLKAIK